jgi:glycosyltransferase involved in cell wall biosynthesis
MGNRSLTLATAANVRRILYVAYPLLPVSDESCGGAEQMLSALEAEIADRGNFTTIAACNGSRARGVVFATGRETTEADQFESRNQEHEERVLNLLRETRGSQPTFDLIHDKSGSFWRRAAGIDVPVLATLHLPRHFYPQHAFDQLAPNLYFNCVSETQRETFADVPSVVATIPNGIDAKRFPLVAEKEDYLLWMGRICEEKGTHLAIEIAKRTGLPLVLVGQVYPFSYHQRYYNERVRPHLGGDNPAICFLETPTLATKLKILSKSRALLMPSLVDETSSLVAMEAMACGTPVIALRRGAIPEVVEDGTTGVICENPQQMAEAVSRISEVNPFACRAHVEQRHSASRMADDYERLYDQVLAMHAAQFRKAA